MPAPHLTSRPADFMPRRSAAKLFLFLLSEVGLRRRPAFVSRLSGVSRPVPMRLFRIVTRFLVKSCPVRALCGFDVRLRCPLLLANLLARRCIAERLDTDVVFLVGTPDLDSKGFRGTGGNLEFGRGVHDADGTDVRLVDAAPAADHRQQPARFRILPAADGSAEPDAAFAHGVTRR